MDRGKSIFISAISVLAVAFLGVLLYAFWPAITGTINGNKYYYASDLQESYDRGYDDGCKSETELTAKVDYYQSLVDEYYIEVQTLNNELSLLIDENSNYEKTILELTNLKIENEITINDLVSIKNENELFIQTLQNEITNLEIELVNLKKSETNKTNEINTLQNQINNLQTLVDSLQKTNTLNSSTIDNLNNQVINLNSQISVLNLKLQQNNSSVGDLNNKIADLEKTVAYYEEYIAGLENATQVVATFEFDGSVYNIQILNKGDIVSVTTPSSTDFVQFNYWMVNEQQVDLATYSVNENTKFVANVTYKNYYEFLVNGEMYNNGYILSGSTLNLVSDPVKDGFEFVGWSIDGVNVIDLNDYEITKNTSFNAVFIQLHTVEFIVDGEVVSTQIVRNGEFANNIEVENTTYITFNYWTVNGSRIDLSSYSISASTTFFADLTYSYDVIFKVDEDVYSSFIVKEGSFITLPNNPEKDKYIFMGWSIDGKNSIDLSNYIIVCDSEFIALFMKNVSTLVDGDTFKSTVGKTVTSIVFDKYSDEAGSSYIIDGVNVIEGVAPTSLSDSSNSGSEINLYMIGTSAYVLSLDIISFNPTSSNMFKYMSSLQSIEFKNIYTGYVTSFGSMFYRCYNLASLNLSNFDTSNVTSMQYMFNECSALTTLDISNFNTCNVSRMDSMFRLCSSLSELNISNFDTSNVTTMKDMFYGCSALTNLNLSHFNTSNLSEMRYMFYNCSGLIYLDISSFDTTNITNMYQLFRGCSSLKTLDLSSFNTINLINTYQMFASCSSLETIYVGQAWDITNALSSSKAMFSNCSSLPNYNESYIDGTYAHTEEGGYLTLKI